MQHHMERFARTIVQKMKDEKLFASQGGPIILLQVHPSCSLQSLLHISYQEEEARVSLPQSANLAVLATDRERVQQRGASIRGRLKIHSVGRQHGRGARRRRAVGDVQAERRSRSRGMVTFDSAA